MTEPTNLVANLDELPWTPDGSHDQPGRYGSEDKILAEHVRQQRMDAVVTRLGPGKASCPYHFHHVGEELFIVLEGHGQVRLPDGLHRLKPHDVVSCPPGPEGAHQFINDTDAPFVYLAISTEDAVEVCEYPDSGKMLSKVDRDGKRVHKHIGRLRDAVPYLDGEAT